MRALEQRLDLKLLNRTTRSVSPTEAGERLYRTVGPRFEDIEAELAVLGEMQGKPAGTIRIAATEHSLRSLIWPRLEPWLPRYPDIKVEINADNRFTEHDCTGLRLASHGGLMKWEFERRRKRVNAHVSGRLVFNSSELIVAAALSGHGLAWVPLDVVQEHIAKGRLVSALDDWATSFAGYHAHYASRSASPALMLVVEALRSPVRS